MSSYVIFNMRVLNYCGLRKYGGSFLSTLNIQDGNVSTLRARISSVGEITEIAQVRERVVWKCWTNRYWIKQMWTSIQNDSLIWKIRCKQKQEEISRLEGNVWPTNCCVHMCCFQLAKLWWEIAFFINMSVVWLEGYGDGVFPWLFLTR